jgi:tetratricopeptide (TPR) repeat protein
VTLRYPLIFRCLALIGNGILIESCQSGDRDIRKDLNEATIAYPFVGPGYGLGRNGKKESFVIRSSVGQAEYAVEIPDAGNGYDIQIPLAALNPPATGEALAVGAKGTRAPNPVATDRELVNSLPSIDKSSPTEIATLDAALGVGTKDGPIQSPSYTMGIAKVNQYYRERNYEVALMELNNLLAFYPNSPKLLKMKGTLLLKTGNQELALRAWQRAVDLSPQDAPLERATKKLQERVVATQQRLPTSGQRPKGPLPQQPTQNQPLDPELEKFAH